MSAIDGVLFDNDTVSHLVKTGTGTVHGVIVNSHSSGTLRLGDATTTVDETADAAVGTLTVSGAITVAAHATSEIVSSGACAPAAYATTVLTSDATNVAEDEVLVMGTITYRFRDTLAQAYDVKIGANAAATLVSLKHAINATGVAGTDYFAGTLVHPTMIAGAIDATTITIWARDIGTTPNTLATTTTAAHLSFADTTLGGGTGASNAGVATTAATITIGSTIYTATLQLAEVIGLTAVPYQVLWETSEAVFLDNLKVAINAGAGAGTKYGTGTAVHPTVLATTNTNTVQTIIAKVIGTAANATATTETLANYAWADTTLGGGTGNSNAGVAATTATVTIDGVTYTFVNELSETSGATAVANQVLHGATVADALDNLKSAINASAGAGTTYGTGTVAHPSVNATTNTDTAQTVAADTAGIAGNSIAVSETLDNGTWGVDVTTLVDGRAAGITLMNTFTFSAGSQVLTFPAPINFVTGLYATVGGTLDYTILYR